MIRTYSDLAAWITGAAEKYGDPSRPILQLAFEWQADLDKYQAAGLAWGVLDGKPAILALQPNEADNGWEVVGLEIPVALDGPIVDDSELKAFAAEKLGPGVWALKPSLNLPGLLHAFVILCGAPDPAPWEEQRRILMPRQTL